MRPARCGRRAAARPRADGRGARRHQPVRVARPRVPALCTRARSGPSTRPCWCRTLSGATPAGGRHDGGSTTRLGSRWGRIRAGGSTAGSRSLGGAWVAPEWLPGRRSMSGSSYHCGIPSAWVDAEDVEWCTAEGIAAVPIDPADPPRFESQAAYLRRHGLFCAARSGG